MEENEQEVVEKNYEGVVENEHEEKKTEGEKNKKKRDEGENNERLIDVDSILRRTKSQILAEGEEKQKVPSYVKLLYRHLSEEKKKRSRKVSSRSLWSYSLSCR